MPGDTLTWLLHQLTHWLLGPVVFALLACGAAALWDTGSALGERFGGLKRLRAAGAGVVERTGRRRIERADILARIGPMLGLMGTLIPLGPGPGPCGTGLPGPGDRQTDTDR